MREVLQRVFARWVYLVRNTHGTTRVQHAHAVADFEVVRVLLADFLHHRNGAAAIKADGDFHALSRADRLLRMGGKGTADDGSADGSCGVRSSAAADGAAQRTAADTAQKSATLITAFYFHVANRRHATRVHGLPAARLAARINITRKAILRT